MIHIEVIKSTDPLALGIYEFEFDQLTIGRSKKNDLIFREVELPQHFIMIKFMQGQLVVQSLTPKPSFFLNGKKVSGTLKFKPNDIIAFGENQIRLLKSESTVHSIDLAPAFAEFHKNSPELQFALHFIEEVLLDLEKDSNV